MFNIIMLMPMDPQVRLAVIVDGVVQAIQREGLKVKVFYPVRLVEDELCLTESALGLSEEEVMSQLIERQSAALLEELVARLTLLNDSVDVILVVGARPKHGYIRQLNLQIAQAYGAWTIPVILNRSQTDQQLAGQIELQLYELNTEKSRVNGVVLDGVPSTWQVCLTNTTLPVIASLTSHMTAQQISSQLSPNWLINLSKHSRPILMSPPAFRYRLTELARQANKRVVLPEGEEPRTIKAAGLCGQSGIAHCVLLGDPVVIKQIAQQQGVSLNKGVDIIDPTQLLHNYVPRLVELRAHKGVTEAIATKMLQDNVILGTLMLEMGEVDGLVSGAIHTTANTIRPALQIIKTAPGNSLVSSIFFMLLPEQTYVFGDCAINLNPTAEELADIAIQSADSASSFGIEPRVAMLSYSTLNSGAGSDVDLVRSATELVKKKRPDILVDGPLQYDAAAIPDVAQTKAPGSPVAGRATVFIFPNLNAGNIGYKAVQRTADLVAIGPMLQGLRKPVNDLSRGALVEDIVYTIALTAIQATQ